MSNLYSKSATMEAEPLIPKRGAIKRRIIAEITDLTVSESALLRGSEDQFVQIENDLRDLDSMLTEAEAMEGSDQELQTLVDAMQQLRVHAEDVVDAFVNERERQSNWGRFRRTIFFFKDMIARHRFQDEVEMIWRSISDLRKRATEMGIVIDASDNIQSAAQRSPKWGPSSASFVKAKGKDVMGLVLHPKAMKSKLIYTDSSSASPSVLPIFGAGKTTLAPHELQLSDEDGWRLLKPKNEVPAELEEIGWRIVQRCMGSRLMISTMGTLLSKVDATPEEWLRVLKRGDYRSVYKAVYDSLADSLEEAADLLPSYLKQCLFYFGLFPKGFDIPARRLIVLWVAEGLVRKDKSSDESPEVRAEKYLSNLIEQNMIQVVKRKPDGRVKTCRMLELARPLWVQKAQEAGFLPAQNRAQASSSSSVATIRRLADHLDQPEDSFSHISFSHIHGYNSSNSSFFRPYYKNLHTLLSFDSREGAAPGKDIGGFLRRGITNRCFQGMRVLDLERLFRPKLPESLGKLIHLRYLGLRWTYLENLPSSIDNLFNLQTLDLKHTYISTLPSSFWKMQQLRHLYLSESYRTRFVPPRGVSSLTDLQTLWGAFVDKETPLANSLYRLTKLRKLGLTCQLNRDQQVATADWILKLERLESLRLISIDISVKPSDLFLMPLSVLENLTSIYLLGKLTNPVMVDAFPRKLTELTLSLSGLTEDPMQKLGKLPNLKILRLLRGAFVRESMSCTRSGFPSLQVLKLWKLEQLKEWEIEKGSLPILQELEIRSCTAIQKIPGELQHLELLLQLKLKDMPEEFPTKVKEVLGEDWYKKRVSVTRSSRDQQDDERC